MHDAACDYVTEVVDRRNLNRPDVAVLDMGGRNVNGTPRGLFLNVTTYLTIDLRAGAGVNIVADAADLTLGRLFDVVLCTECLEHAPRAPQIVATAHRHLRAGGIFIATMAGPGRKPHGVNGEEFLPRGEFYRNVTPADLEEWLHAAGFSTWHIDQKDCDLRCTACP